MKRPAFQFYPADWVKDLGLRRCSLAARGLWLEMLCMAHESERYGCLVLNGAALTDGEVVDNVKGASLDLLGELDRARVFSRDAVGTIYSRRMVRDERRRLAWAEAGKLGAEHGWKGGEFGKLGGRPRKNPPNNPPEPGLRKPPTSSSSSSSLRSSKTLVAAKAAPRSQTAPRRVNGNGKSHALRLPAEWELPEAWLAWATAYRTDWNEERVLRESLVFRDHWLAAPGAKGTKADWAATWRNWIRRST